MKRSGIFFLILTLSLPTEQLLASLAQTPTATPVAKTVTQVPQVVSKPPIASNPLKTGIGPQVPISDDLFAVKKLPPLHETLTTLLNIIEKSSRKKNRPKTLGYAFRISKTCIKEIKKKLKAESPETNLISDHLKKLNEELQALFSNLAREGLAGKRKMITVDGGKMPALSQLDLAKLEGAFDTFRNSILKTSMSTEFKETLITLCDVVTDNFVNKGLYPALSLSQSVEGYLVNLQQQLEENLEYAQENKWEAIKKFAAYASMLSTAYFAYREKVFDRPMDMFREAQWKYGRFKKDVSAGWKFLKNPIGGVKKIADNLSGRVDELPNNITFNDIIGLKDDVKNLKSYAKIVKNFNKNRITQPRNFLLYGPPGTGKSWLATAFAKEANVSILTRKLADLNHENWSALPSLFDEAKTHPKSVIFIDEIDKLTSKRQGELLGLMSTEADAATHGERLTVVIATANNIDKSNLVDALKSRFSDKRKIILPTEADVEEIIKTLLNKLQKEKQAQIDTSLTDKTGDITLGEEIKKLIQQLIKERVSRRDLGQAILGKATTAALEEIVESGKQEPLITNSHVKKALQDTLTQLKESNNPSN